MNKRIKNANRFRLNADTAALEHELNEYINYFTAKDPKIVRDIYMEAAIEHKNKWGYPLVCNRTLKRRNKNGKSVKISDTMDRFRNPDQFANICSFKNALNDIDECDVDK